MPYQSTEKTRQKKDTKRTAMMQAAVRTFADKGYQAATVRDIVNAADVAIGTFYFYFPDKETLFLHLYEETGDFVLHTVQQALNSRMTYPRQVQAAVQAYVNIAVFEPAIIQLLLVGGVGALPSLTEKHAAFREKLIQMWQRPISDALDRDIILPQNDRRAAEGVAGAIDEVVLNLISQPDSEAQANGAVQDLTAFILRATGYYGKAAG